jgi:hypothetical protein
MVAKPARILDLLFLAGIERAAARMNSRRPIEARAERAGNQSVGENARDHPLKCSVGILDAMAPVIPFRHRPFFPSLLIALGAWGH